MKLEMLLQTKIKSDNKGDQEEKSSDLQHPYRAKSKKLQLDFRKIISLIVICMEILKDKEWTINNYQ